MKNNVQIEEISRRELKYCDEFKSLFGDDRRYRHYINNNNAFF